MGKKSESGSNIIYPKILRLLGIILSEEEGRRTEFREENQDLRKKCGWGRKSSYRELYTPLYQYIKDESMEEHLT